MNTIFKFLVLCFLSSCRVQQDPAPSSLWILSAPAGNRFTGVNGQGETVIPNGRIVNPAGKSILTAPHPYGLTLSPDGRLENREKTNQIP